MVTGAVKAAVSYRDLAAPSLPPQGRIYPARLDLRTEICDGFRVLAVKHRDKITLVSRRGTNLLPCYPEIGECLKALPDLALDAELVIWESYLKQIQAKIDAKHRTKGASVEAGRKIQPRHKRRSIDRQTGMKKSDDAHRPSRYG